MTPKTSNVFNFFSEYFQILLGIVLASIGLKAFLLPNGFMDGGVTGIALLINKLININTPTVLVRISKKESKFWLT